MGYCIGKCCEDDQPPPFGLQVRAKGCGCGCYDPGCTSWPIPWAGQSGTPLDVCGYSVTVKLGSTVVATCTASSTYPCTPCRFLGLTPGVYTIIVSHPKYGTSTATYNYFAPTTADRVYTATLCAASGYHCLGCAEPSPDSLTLTIVKDLSFLSFTGPPVYPIPTAGMAVPLAWQPWPIPNTTVCGIEVGTYSYLNTLPGSCGWFGEATTEASVPIGIWSNKTAKLNCDTFLLPYPVGECFREDCGHWEFEDRPITLWFWLYRCRQPWGGPSSPAAWKLSIFGPQTGSCRTGPYCGASEGFFLADSPLPSEYRYTCNGVESCQYITNSYNELYAGLPSQAEVSTCNPLAIKFMDLVDVTNPGLGSELWGTVS